MARRKAFAAIDVGSHEIQMQIAELDRDQAPKTIETLRRTLPLGTDTYTTGVISQDLLTECLSALQGLVQEMTVYRITDYRAVATSAFREAANRAYVLDQIERHCGLSIQVLDNAEERAYHILAAATRLSDFQERIHQGTLIVDVGAGSIQVTVFAKGRFVFSQNMLLGSLRIRELLADLEQRTADFAGLMDEYISSDLDHYRLLEPKGITYQHLIILGGEMPYLKKMAGLDPDSNAKLSGSQLEQLYGRLLETKPFDLASQRGIPAEHATLLLPTAILLRKFVRYTNLNEITLPATNICDAILAEFAGRYYGYKLPHNLADDIICACRHIAQRYQVNQAHNDAVEWMALKMFDETKKLHRLQERERLLLQATVILHDIGKYVNMSRHHVQSREIILATEIVGLSRREKAIVAWAAGFHIGTFSMEATGFSELTDCDQLLVAKLTALLRLANALDNGHQQKINDLAVQIEADRLILQISASQPVVLEIWTLEHNSRLFTSLFGIRPVIKVRGKRS